MYLYTNELHLGLLEYEDMSSSEVRRPIGAEASTCVALLDQLTDTCRLCNCPRPKHFLSPANSNSKSFTLLPLK